MSEWFTWLSLEGQLATWLVASFLLYTLASQLAWQFQWSLFDGYSSVRVASQSGASEPDVARPADRGEARGHADVAWHEADLPDLRSPSSYRQDAGTQCQGW